MGLPKFDSIKFFFISSYYKQLMSYRRRNTHGIVREIGSGMHQFNQGFRALRRWAFPRRVPRTIKRYAPNNNVSTTLSGVQVEKKSVEYPVSGTFTFLQPSDIISSVLLNGIEEGTSLNQRVGRKVTLASSSVKYTVVSPADFSSTVVRFTVVFDKQPNGTSPTAADLFMYASEPANSNFNLNNRQRFITIYDKRMTLNPIDSSHTYQHSGSIPIRVKGKSTTYKNSGNQIGDIATGSLYLIVSSPAANGGANNTKAIFYYNSRTRYIDV